MDSSSSSSNSNSDIIHLALFPFTMAQGHMIPMLDIAKLLISSSSSQSIQITIFTTPNSPTPFSDHDCPQIQIALLHPSSTTSHQLTPSSDFFSSLARDLKPQALTLAQSLSPKPSALISDTCLPWTLDIAAALRVPWVSFSGGSCFGSAVMRKIHAMGSVGVENDGEYFEVGGLEDRIGITKAQLPAGGLSDGMRRFVEEIGAAERKGFGRIVNSFEELEGFYVEELRREGKVWCVGPVSLCNQHYHDKALRGKSSTNQNNNKNKEEQEIMKWLDSQAPKSVLYICLGSLHNLKTPQLIHLGLALEISNTPFIWVLRSPSNKLQNWIKEQNFEQKIKEKGLIIRDWAPQLLILPHPSIGGFLTHCGWNSILEGICAGLPMLTWPLFSDQFLNEKFVVHVLRIGVRIGAEFPVMNMNMNDGDEDEEGIVEVKEEDVREGIWRLMGNGDEAEERRKRVREFGDMAKNAFEDGGSSRLNIRSLIDDIMNANKISS